MWWRMNANKPLRYQLPGDVGEVLLSASALAHFRKRRQLKCLSKEAGGQLFADLSIPGRITVLEATGPRSTDRCSVFSYRPDRTAERLEIADRYKRGLHFVGDWHTHREDNPRPSSTDIRSMAEMFRESGHSFPGFLMVIVGRKDGPEALYVSYHSGHGWTRLDPSEFHQASTQANTEDFLRSNELGHGANR
jgi:integrative and conjugative element protein (TIGR02256 family)